MQMMNAALAYACRGWHVFPCKPRSKYPATEHGYKDATTNEERITRYWQRVPSANIGIATGTVSGFFVVDVDVWDTVNKKPKRGLESWEALQAASGYGIPITHTQKTGSGGYQMLFKMPAGMDIRNSTSRLAQDVDVRGNGGYIVASPSIHPNGKVYAWLEAVDMPIMDAPAWLIELAAYKPTQVAIEPKHPNLSASQSRGYIAGLIRTLQNARNGERNNSLLWCACRMFDHGAVVAEVESTLVPIAVQIGLKERESIATIHSAQKQERRDTRAVSSPEKRQQARLRRMGR